MTMRGQCPEGSGNYFPGPSSQKGRCLSACGIHPGVFGAQAYDLWKTGLTNSIREMVIVENFFEQFLNTAAVNHGNLSRHLAFQLQNASIRGRHVRHDASPRVITIGSPDTHLSIKPVR
jgi:hypothetical protein